MWMTAVLVKASGALLPPIRLANAIHWGVLLAVAAAVKIRFLSPDLSFFCFSSAYAFCWFCTAVFLPLYARPGQSNWTALLSLAYSSVQIWSDQFLPPLGLSG